MTSTIVDPNRAVSCVEDGEDRICVFGMDGAEICGAFKPAGRPYWLVYISTTVAAAAGHSHRHLVPAHLQLWDRQIAREWVELIAHLYARSATV